MNEKHIKALIEAVKTDIAKIAGVAAVEYIDKRRQKEAKSRHDWRLRNTRLLLKHYNYFKEHIDSAIYSTQQLEAMDIIAEMDDVSAKVNIDSIKKSAQKTFVIIQHINKMLDLYESYADRKGQTEQRRIRVLRQYFFHGRRLIDIAEGEHVVERTCQRDLEEAINTLSALIFGIESVNEMVE